MPTTARREKERSHSEYKQAEEKQEGFKLLIQKTIKSLCQIKEEAMNTDHTKYLGEKTQQNDRHVYTTYNSNPECKWSQFFK